MRRLRRRLAIVVGILLLATQQVQALDGVYHRPYGKDDIYVSSDSNTDRWPLDPYAGQIEYIKITTWPVEAGDSVVVNWSKNNDGINRQATAAWQFNSGNNSYWQAAICDPNHYTNGSSDICNEGDQVTYTVVATQSGGATKTIGPYSYITRKAPVDNDYYVYLTSVSSATRVSNHVELSVAASDSNFSPKVAISFPYADAVRVQVAPNPAGVSFADGISSFTLDTSNGSQYAVYTSSVKVLIQTNPWRLTFQKWNGSTWVQVLQEYDPTRHHNIQWDGANNGIWHVGEWFTSQPNEYYVGFGARYNSVYKRNEDVDIYAYNQYKNQGGKTYLPIPFYHSTAGYSLFVNSWYYTKFRLNTETVGGGTPGDIMGWNSDSSKDGKGTLDYTVYTGTPKTALGEFTQDTGGHPVVPPEWALGPIMSANEWNSDSEATAQLNTTLNDQIPATLMVLEQWSDETTFYVWKDANFTPNDGSTYHSYGDFTWGSSWPNPKAFVDNLHNNHVRLILWQVPLNKVPDGNSTNPNSITEDNNNASYMEDPSRKYAAWDPPTGSYYHNAAGWFPNAPFVDFTNTNAANWWLNKRNYLFNMGGGTHIDGFKTDGGEDIWYEDTTFTSATGDTATKRMMHNKYPATYTSAYYNYVQSQTGGDGIIFARTGGIGAQLTPVYWAGDQNSDFGEFAGQVTAAITAGASGVPFYGWDLAGFSGGVDGSDIPSVELYDRSWPVAAFAPITQYHSENNGSDEISHARSPWNMQARTGDASTFNTGKKYANMRMNLLPYIWSSAIQTGQTGVPLMRALYLEFPSDTSVINYPTEYMFGDSFLVTPVLTQGAGSQTVYLPAGEWIDFANGGRHYGGSSFSYGLSDYSTVPIFVKAGSIIPMNLDNTFTPGTWVGNDVNSTTNLTFTAYPGGNTSYTWYRNRDGSNPLNLTMTEDYLHHTVTVTYPAGTPAHYWRIFTTQPSSVVVGGTTYTQQTSLSNLLSAASGWYYDSQNQFLYVKNPAASTSTTMTLNGTDKAGFEAEFGTYNGTCSATDHPGYTGTGFVACFDVSGRSQDVPVTVTAPATYQLNFRYSNGNTGDAIRTIYVDGNYFSRLSFPSTGSWDTWSTVPLLVSLTTGQHSIKVAYDSDGIDTGAINLDNIGLVATPGPGKAFNHEEVLIGNNYYVAMLDRRGTLYDTQEPMGMYSGVSINDQNPTYNVSTAIHAQQGVVGISLSGQDPQWFSGPNWTFSNQDYLTDTAIYQLTATNSGLNLTVTEQDFSPRGITFPTATDPGNPPVNGLYVKRLAITNNAASSQTIDVSYWTHLSLDMEPYNDSASCNTTDDAAYFNDPGGYGSGRDRTIAYGVKLKAPAGATTSCTAYAGAALQKKTFSIGAGATQEVDILVVGATKTPANQPLYSSWIQPALTWFNNNDMNSIQGTTQTSWTNLLAEATTLDGYPTGGSNIDYNKVLHRALVLSLLHIDLTHGGVAAGFKNIGYPAMWPRDTVYGALTLDRAGIRDYANTLYGFLSGLSRMGGGEWYQKYMLDGTPQWTQPQADETAIIPYGLYQHYLQTGDATFLNSFWTMTQNAAAAVMPGASDTGYGWDSSSHLWFSNNIWEDTYGEFLYTNAAIVAGLQAAANIATIEGDSTLATNWNNQANDIWNNGISGTITNSSPLSTPGMYDSDVGRFLYARNVRKTQTDGPALVLNPISADVSNLGLVWPFHLIAANDPKMVATANEVEAGLGDTSEVGSSGGIARYRHDQNSRYSPSGNPDYSPFNDTYFDGGPWTVATLWMANYKLALAQYNTGHTYVDAGKTYLDRVINWLGPLYIGAEQVDHLAGQQADGSWPKQAAWPNLWESNASLADTLMNLLDYNWNATTGTLVMKPKLPSSWTALGGNITIVPNGASSQKVYVKHQHPGGSSPDTVIFQNNTSATAITIDLYVQTDFNPSSVTGLGGLTWSYDANSGRVRIQGSTAAGSSYTITLNR